MTDATCAPLPPRFCFKHLRGVCSPRARKLRDVAAQVVSNVQQVNLPEVPGRPPVDGEADRTV